MILNNKVNKSIKNSRKKRNSDQRFKIAYFENEICSKFIKNCDEMICDDENWDDENFEIFDWLTLTWLLIKKIWIFDSSAEFMSKSSFINSMYSIDWFTIAKFLRINSYDISSALFDLETLF